MLAVWGRRSSFKDTPEFLAMNPHGRVPVIDDDGVIVWESQTILRYLAAKYGRGRFWSDEPAERSHAERWMDWSQASLQPDFLNGVFWGFYRMPEAKRNLAAIARKVATCAQHFALLDRILADRPFLCGDDLTLADIPAGTSLYRYFEIDIDRPKVPNVEAWYRRLQARPAYREHVMVPFAELYGRLDF
jgi:glutathione S-transferase